MQHEHEHKNGAEHAHEPHDHSDHSHDMKGVKRGVLVAVLVLSLSYMVAEIVGGIISGSLALLADAGHMALDAAAIALGLFAFWISKRPPNERKTFGYYRVEILAATANAATLVLISLWIFYEAWARLKSPPVVQGALMSVVAAGGLLVNALSLFLLAKASRDNFNMRGVWMHVMTDALGSVSALLAGFVVWKFGWSLADPIISIVIGLLILYGGWKLLLECVDVLLIAVPNGVDPTVIRGELEHLPGVSEVHDLHIWAMNTGVNSLSAHLRMKPGTESKTVLDAATEVLKRKYHIEHATLQLEPDDFSHRETDFCAPGKPFRTPES